MDSVDQLILHLIAANGRITWSELASQVGLSAPAAAERVRRLEERGVIVGYAAMLDRSAVGLGLTAFVSLSLADRSRRAAFLEAMAALPEVLEVHHVTGDFDYLLKVVCRDPRELDSLLNERIKGDNEDYVARSHSVIVLGSPKDMTLVPPRPAS